LRAEGVNDALRPLAVRRLCELEHCAGVDPSRRVCVSKLGSAI
jgi:hypothetical protein